MSVNSIFNTENRIEGHVKVSYKVEEKGSNHELSFANTVVYGGADIIARALVGETKQSITGLYIAYCNGTPSFPTIDRDFSIDYFHGLGSTYGLIVVPVIGLGFSSSDDTKYVGNILTIYGATGTHVVSGPGLIDGTSKMFAAGLVYSPSSDYAQDKLFSAVVFKNSDNNPVSITKVANASVGVTWSITIK